MTYLWSYAVVISIWDKKSPTDAMLALSEPYWQWRTLSIVSCIPIRSEVSWSLPVESLSNVIDCIVWYIRLYRFGIVFYLCMVDSMLQCMSLEQCSILVHCGVLFRVYLSTGNTYCIEEKISRVLYCNDTIYKNKTTNSFLSLYG